MPTLRLVSLDTGQVLEIHDRGVVGRQPSVDALIEDSSVSRQHAVIEHGPRGWTLSDHGSANGTWIGDQRVSAAYLNNGHQVRFGLVTFRVEIPPEQVPTTVMPAVAARPAPRPAPPAVDEPLPPTVHSRPAFGRSAPALSVTGVLDFNGLPPRTRQRLVDCLAGRTEPKPLAVAREPGLAGPVLALPILGLALLGVFAIDFGAPGSAWLPRATLIVVGTLVLGLTRALFATLYRFVRSRSLPFAAGRYLFPLDVVEAGWNVARWPILSAEKVDAVHHLNQGRYSHTALSLKFPGRPALAFDLRPRAHAEAVLVTLQAARDAAAQAQAAGDARPPARLDPLGDA